MSGDGNSSIDTSRGKQGESGNQRDCNNKMSECSSRGTTSSAISISGVQSPLTEYGESLGSMRLLSTSPTGCRGAPQPPQFDILAEAAKRAEMSLLIRDLEEL